MSVAGATIVPYYAEYVLGNLSLAAWLTGILLALMGYIANQVQTGGTIFGISLLKCNRTQKIST